MPFDLQLGDPVVQRILLTALLLVAAFVLTKLGQRLVARYIDDPARRYRASKFIGHTASLIALLAVVGIWSARLGSLLAILTLIAAGLTIAMRDVVLSFVGWVDIALRSPFEQGDRIEINGIRGDVVDIRLLHSTLMEINGWIESDQSTGRLVHIPNSWVYQHAVYNYTRGFNFLWNEIPVTLTFRSDWKAAREIMLELAEESAEIVEQQAMQQLRRLSREYLIHFSILTPFVYVKITEDGIRLTLRYLCEVRKRRGTTHAITLGILERFQEHGQIELAYPMRGARLFDTPQFGHGPTFDASPRQPESDGPPDAGRRDRG